jgi:thymidylate synthase (FAD)
LSQVSNVVEFDQEYLSFIKTRLIGITTPVVDFIPDSEGILSFCARVSSPQNQDNFETANKLLAYCVRQSHWSVFDMVNVVVEVEVPRDIARQFLRHSSIKFQEFSQRYAEAQEFVIREARLQDSKNRQNSIDLDVLVYEDAQMLQREWNKRQREVIDLVKKNYQWAIDNDIAKECARVVLPEGNTMSYLYANMTVRQLITYLKVRDDVGVTQKEHVDMARKIRVVALDKLPSIEGLV